MPAEEAMQNTPAKLARSFAVVLAFALVAASCGDDDDGGSVGGLTAETSEACFADAGLDAISLDGATLDVAELAYIFADIEGSDIAFIEFYLDDPLAQGAPIRAEGLAPYDLAGGTAALANGLDLRDLGPGLHLLTAIAVHTDGARSVVIVSFGVADPRGVASEVLALI